MIAQSGNSESWHIILSPISLFSVTQPTDSQRVEDMRFPCRGESFLHNALWYRHLSARAFFESFSRNPGSYSSHRIFSPKTQDQVQSLLSDCRFSKKIDFFFRSVRKNVPYKHSSLRFSHLSIYNFFTRITLRNFAGVN